jgi:hypothetical protein
MRCGQALVKKQLEDFKKWRDDFVSGAWLLLCISCAIGMVGLVMAHVPCMPLQTRVI